MDAISRFAMKVALPALLIAAALYLGALVFQLRHMPFGQGLQNSYAGRISSVEGNTLRVVDSVGAEHVVLITPDTLVRKGREAPGLSALVAGEYIVVFGPRSDTGAYQAQLIRIVSTGSAPATPAPVQ